MEIGVQGQEGIFLSYGLIFMAVKASPFLTPQAQGMVLDAFQISKLSSKSDDSPGP